MFLFVPFVFLFLSPCVLRVNSTCRYVLAGLLLIHPSLPPSHPSSLSFSGGNDVMSVKDNCVAYDARCKQQIAEAMSILTDLLERMHKDGIQHVIFMG